MICVTFSRQICVEKYSEIEIVPRQVAILTSCNDRFQKSGTNVVCSFVLATYCKKLDVSISFGFDTYLNKLEINIAQYAHVYRMATGVTKYSSAARMVISALLLIADR